MFNQLTKSTNPGRSKRMSLIGRLLLGIVFSIIAARPAAAGTTDSIEIQFSTVAFGGLLRQQFIMEQMCPEEVEWQGQDCIIDHIDYETGHFNLSPGMTNIEVNDTLTINGIQAVRYVQPITVYIKTVECLEDADCSQHEYLDTQTIQVIFNLSANANGGHPQICVTYEDVFPPVPWLQTMLEQGIGGVLGGNMESCVGVPTGSLMGIIGDSYEPFGAGLALNSNQNRLGIRVQFRKPGSIVYPGFFGLSQAQIDEAHWFDFLNGNLGPAPANEEWSMLVGSSLVRAGVLDKLTDGISSSSFITIDYGDGHPTSSWTGYGFGGGQVYAEMYAEVDIGCWITTIGLDPIWFYMPMHLSQPKESIVIDGYVYWDVNDGDIHTCAIAHAVFGDFLTYTVLTTVLGVFAENYEPNLPTNLGGGCTVTDSHHFECDLPFTLPVIDLSPGGWSPSSQMRVNGMIGYAQGLSLHGWMAPMGWQFQLPAYIKYYPTHYGLTGGCSNLRVGWIDPKLEVNNAQLCDSYERSDEENPGHMLLTVLTTRGSRTIRWKIPEEPTEDEKMGYQLALIMAKILCMSPQTGLFGIPGMYDPHWDIDPPPFEDIFHRLDSRLGNVGRGTATLEKIRVKAGPDLAKSGRLDPGSVVLVIEAQMVVATDKRSRLNEQVSMEFTMGMIEELAEEETQVSLTAIALENAIIEHDALAFDPNSLDRAGMTSNRAR